MISDRIVGAWAEFQEHSGGFGRPRTEDDYLQLITLLNDITDNYDCAIEPNGSLFDMISGYMHDWELEHEPELKDPEVSPQDMLASLMDEHQITQNQLSQEGVVDQGNLSRILAGKRNISKELAKRLADRFSVSPDLFI